MIEAPRLIKASKKFLFPHKKANPIAVLPSLSLTPNNEFTFLIRAKADCVELLIAA